MIFRTLTSHYQQLRVAMQAQHRHGMSQACFVTAATLQCLTVREQSDDSYLGAAHTTNTQQQLSAGCGADLHNVVSCFAHASSISRAILQPVTSSHCFWTLLNRDLQEWDQLQE